MKTLLRIAEIKHITKDGSILWQSKNLKNTFHSDGEYFCLRSLFIGGQASTIIPGDYYFGLDNRPSISIEDTMSTIENYGNEPSSGGYSRQIVSSKDQFSIDILNGHAVVTSPIVTFVANPSGVGWGPISSLFLTDKGDYMGYLISTVPLDQEITVAPGEGIYMRMTLTLGDDPNLPDLS